MDPVGVGKGEKHKKNYGISYEHKWSKLNNCDDLGFKIQNGGGDHYFLIALSIY